MRVFLICQQSPIRHPIPAYDFWAVYLRSGLTEAGHTVFEVPDVDWARGLLPLSHAERASWRTEIWGSTLEAAGTVQLSGGLDLVLSYLYPEQIEKDALKALRGFGAPAVNFFCDHLRQFRDVPEEFEGFDLNWVPEYAALSWYRKRGWPCIHAPMPCWVAPPLRTPPEIERPVISFVGSRDATRADLLAVPARAGLPLEVRGAGWAKDDRGVSSPAPSWAARWRNWENFLRRQGAAAAIRRVFGRRGASPDFDFSPFIRPSPPAAEYPGILRESAISLGVNRYPTLRRPSGPPATFSRLRDIEAPMLGACYLTEWTEGIEQLYEPGAEIVTYKSGDELVDASRKLLADVSLRRRLRAAGQRRALAHHTVGHTLGRIAQALGI